MIRVPGNRRQSAGSEHAAAVMAGRLPFARHSVLVAVMLIATVGSMLAFNVASAKPAHASGGSCYYHQAIKSVANGLYVSAELGDGGAWYGMLRARNSWVGPWELFTICDDAFTGLTTIQSEANGLYVSAELGYGGQWYGMLRARSSSVGAWEEFYTGMVDYPNFIYRIQSNANGYNTSARLDYSGADYGMLQAGFATWVGSWEKFVMYHGSS